MLSAIYWPGRPDHQTDQPKSEMGASRADKELYFQKLKELLNKYRKPNAVVSKKGLTRD